MAKQKKGEEIQKVLKENDLLRGAAGHVDEEQHKYATDKMFVLMNDVRRRAVKQ